MNSLPSLDSWREITHNETDLQYNSPFFIHRRHDSKVDNLPYVNHYLLKIMFHVLFFG